MIDWNFHERLVPQPTHTHAQLAASPAGILKCTARIGLTSDELTAIFWHATSEDLGRGLRV